MITIRSDKNDILNLVMNGVEAEKVEGFIKGYDDRWGIEHNIGYPGESLVLFKERKLHKNPVNFRAFLYAVCLTMQHEYEHYDEQKSMFAERVETLKEYNKDGLVALLIQLWKYGRKDITDIDTTFISLLKNVQEQFAAINLLQIFGMDDKELVIQILKEINFNTLGNGSVYDNLPIYKVAVRLYETLRFKKVELKAVESGYEFFIHLWRLSKNELKLDVVSPYWKETVKPYAQALKMEEDSVVILNYLLMSWDRDWDVKITVPAVRRVFDEFLKIELTKNEPVCEDFRKELKKTSLSLKEIGLWLSLIPNQENLIFLNETYGLQNMYYSLSFISMLDNPLFTYKNAKYHIGAFMDDPKLEKHLEQAEKGQIPTMFKTNVKLQIFQLVEKKRIEWSANGNVKYLGLLFEMGLYDSMDYQKIKEIGLKSPYFSYLNAMKLKGREGYEAYVKHLSIVPTEERQFVNIKQKMYYYGDVNSDFIELEVYNHVEDKLGYLKLALETNAVLNPSDYGNNLYRFYEQKKETLGKEIDITEEQFLSLLRQAKEQDMFSNERIKNTVNKLFMTEKEKEENEKNLLLARIDKAIDLYDVTSIFKTISDFLHYEDVQRKTAEKINELSIKYNSDIRKIYDWVFKHKNDLIKEVAEIIIDKLDKVILEKERYDEQEFSYNLYVAKLFRKQNRTKKENETCLQEA